MGITISSLMKEEHRRINEMLNVFDQKKKNNFKEALELFKKFDWNLKKHFFLEEKAIFEIYGSITGQEVSDIFELMEEHGTILDLLKGIEQSIESWKEPATSLVRETLEKHSDFEDSVFYPKLDKELSEGQKSEIAERAKEILRGWFTKSFLQ